MRFSRTSMPADSTMKLKPSEALHLFCVAWAQAAERARAPRGRGALAPHHSHNSTSIASILADYITELTSSPLKDFSPKGKIVKGDES